MPTRVLLCDTADEVARFQYHLLREHDLEVEVTTDAFRGVEAAVRSRPDVIVSELTLEGLGGAELVKRFLASSPSSKFVAHTVVRDPVKVTEVLAAGASGYVLKEDPVEDALRAIRAASTGAVTLSGQVAGLLSNEIARAVEPLARAGDGAPGRPRRRGAGIHRQGRLPRQHLPRAPDTGDGRQGDRLRPEEPGRPR